MKASHQMPRSAAGPRSAAVRGTLATAALATIGLLGACSSVGPDYVPPEIQAPADFSTEFERGLRGESADLAGWWKQLGDPALDDLVERALDRNLDVRVALERISEARAFRGGVATDLVPRVDVGGSYTRRQASQETSGGSFVPRADDSFSLGLDASWELDFWGRIRRTVEAADADIGASVEDARDALVTVMAETALNYVDLRAAQQRAAIARANVGIQAQTLALTEDRFQAGLVSELDVAQAGANLESTRSTLPPLEAQARAARNRLAVLLGLFPGALEETLAVPREIPAPPGEVAVGIPADVIRRRPDIRRAERELAAQTARIGVAEAELYPRFALLGTLGLEAEDVGQFFRRSAAGFTLGPSFTWNVFDRSRILDGVAVQDARQRQALLRYERAVLRALEEVENAMTCFVRDQASRDALTTAVTRTRRAVELSEDQYRQGLVGFQSVLDTQRRLFELEDALVTTKAAITTDLILLFKSLGGGWAARDVVLVLAEGEGEVKAQPEEKRP